MRFASIAFCILALQLGGAAWAADTDGDFVEDGMDNCWQRSNPSQRDSDGDGIGDGCDPDFDQDGFIGDADRIAFLAEFLGSEPIADFDEDGHVDFADLGRLRAALSGAPGPASAPVDDDGDGVLGAADACPNSLVGGAAIHRGCKFVDFSREPRRLVTGQAEDAMRALRGLGTFDSEYLPSLDLTEALADDLVAAADLLARGSACEASTIVTRVHTDLSVASRSVDVMVERTIGTLWQTTPLPSGVPGVDYHEFHGVDEAFEIYSQLQSEMARAVSVLDASKTAAQAACDELESTGTFRGRIVNYDPSMGVIELDTGDILTLVKDHVTNGTSAPAVSGALVDVGAAQLRDGSYIGTQVTLLDIPAVIGLIQASTCLKLKVLPIQPPPGQIVHDVDAYIAANRLRLERGMKLAVEEENCPSAPAGKTYRRFAVYSSSSWDHIDQFEFDQADAPVEIPYNSALPDTFNLTYETWVTECVAQGLGNNCSEPQLMSSRTFAVTLLDSGDYCELRYDRDLMYLDAPGANSYNGAVLIGQQHNEISPASGNPTTTATALGWRMQNDISSYPNVLQINQNQGFAVYTWDFGDGWGGLEKDSDRFAAHGTLDRGGLIWPAMVGSSAGRPFRYSCHLPELVRDAIADCGPTEEPTFFTSPINQSTVGQGPGGSFTHQNSQAWDMPASQGTTIYAARGGIVTEVIDWSDENCTTLQQCLDNNVVGNGIKILHDDGTTSLYWHLQEDGARVDEGERVFRGQFIGWSGNTGFSTGPHLHYSTKKVVGNLTLRADSSFHALQDVGQYDLERFCWEPTSGQTIKRIQ